MLKVYGAVLCLTICWVGGFVVNAAHGSTFVLMDDQQLLETSAVVVTGTVTVIESAEGPEGGIQTYIHIQPDRIIKGSIGNDPLVIREPGGTVGEMQSWVYGAPEFQVGERALVFLVRNPDGTLQTNSLAMGKFTLDVDANGHTIATRDFGYGTALLSPGTTPALVAPQARSERFAPLLNRLRKLAQGQPGLAVDVPILTPPELSTATTEFRERFAFLGSPPARWFEPDSGASVNYLIDSTGDLTLGFASSQATIDAALAAWTNVPSATIILGDAGTTAPGPYNQCNITRIVFNDPFNDLSHTGCAGTLAMGGYCSIAGSTTQVNGTTFKQIVSARITFNSGLGGCSYWTECGVAEVATHELGHTIGLGHSSDPSATMYGSAHFDGRCAGLASDDIAGVSFIYPDTGASPVPTFTRTPTPVGNPTVPPVPTFTPTSVPIVAPTRTPTPSNTPTVTPTPSCLSATTPKVVIGLLDHSAGSQTVLFQGRVTLPAAFAQTLNPTMNGVRLLIVTTPSSLVDITIPGGSYAKPPGFGWKVNRKGTTWTYTTQTPTLTAGIYKVVIQNKSASSPGLVTFVVRGKKGAYLVGTGDLPLTAQIVLAPEAGQCAKAIFSGPGPAPSCGLNRSGSRLTCQ